MPTIYLRPVPSDANPADGRLYDPTVPDSVALDAIVAGPQAVQVGALAGIERLSATDTASQTSQAGAIAASMRLSATDAGSQSEQGGSSTGAQPTIGTVAGDQAPQTGQVQASQPGTQQPIVYGGVWRQPHRAPRYPIAAAVGGAQSGQGGVIVAATGPSPDIRIVYDWEATDEEMEETLLLLVQAGAI